MENREIDTSTKGSSEDTGGPSEQRAPSNASALEKLCGLAQSAEHDSRVVTNCAFELQDDAGAEGRRQGPVLRFFAQLIANTLNEDRQYKPYKMVVAATLVHMKGELRFVVAINGNEHLLDNRESIFEKVPRKFGGIAVDVILDDEFVRSPVKSPETLIALLANRSEARSSSGFVSKLRLYDVDAETWKQYKEKHGLNGAPGAVTLGTLLAAQTVWQWHAEQKLLRFIKKAYGQQVRSSVVALGISKIPCSEQTTDAPNYCEEYLLRKHLRTLWGTKDEGRKSCNVAAYWYTQPPRTSLKPRDARSAPDDQSGRRNEKRGREDSRNTPKPPENRKRPNSRGGQ